MFKKLFFVSFALVFCLGIVAQGAVVNRYSFNEGDTVAVDSIGGKDGALDGTATISGGKLILDGGGSVHLPGDILDPGLESVTIEAWYTENHDADIWTRLFDFGGTAADGGGGYVMFCVPHQYGTTRFTVATKGFPGWQTGEETVSGPIFTGEQTHVVCVWDGPGAEIKIYMNGVLQEAIATTMDLSLIARENAYIGDSCYTGDPYMIGTVDEFRIYNTALADAEVLDSFNAGPDAEISAEPAEPVVIVYENDFEDPCQVDALSGWNWADAEQVHTVAYVDYDGNIVVEHIGTIDNSAGTADINTRFGSKWGITLSGNTSSDPNDYTIEFDLRSVSGNWDPIDLEFYVLTGGGNGVGYGSGISQYAQADGWVHVSVNLADLAAGWWAGTDWDMTAPDWQIEVGGPAWPGVAVPAGTPAWDQIWLMDNLKITMAEPGPKIAWVTETVDRDEDGVQDDQEWIDWLVAAGYDVDVQPDRYLTLGDDQDPNDANDYVAELNAADLVIISRTASSGGYASDANEVAAWASVTAPMISISAWHVRSNRLQWINSSTVNRTLDTYMLALETDHPIFDGVTLEDGLVELVFTEGFADGYQGNCVIGGIDVGNGTLIGQSFSDETMIAEWPAGIAGYDGADVVQAGPRMLFCAGTENASTTANLLPQGAWNLTAAGEQMFANAIEYMIPEEPEGPSMEGLVAYYALEGDALDSSGNGLDGALEVIGSGSDATFVDGAVGTAIDLLPNATGTEGPYVNCGADPMFDLVDEVTVGAWVNIRSIPDEWRAIVAKGDSAWRIGNVGADPRFHFGFCGYGSRATTHGIDGAIEVGFDEWHYVCGTYDITDGAKLYVDGVLDVEVADTAGINVNTYDVTIGANMEDTGWKPYRLFDGTIDEVMVYNRALSADEVVALAGL
jgi:hypothetical protein